jgi:hypothetical protein
MYRVQHKVHIFKEYHSVCPLAGIGTLPPPLSPASVPLPPELGGGGTLACVRGVGGVPIPTTEKKLIALCLLCGIQYRTTTTFRDNLDYKFTFSMLFLKARARKRRKSTKL